jgi:hypothetical protein
MLAEQSVNLRAAIAFEVTWRQHPRDTIVNNRTHARLGLTTLAAASFAVLAGCVEAPPPRPAPPPPPPVNLQVYAYPLQNQTPDQQGKDRYECSTWATQQTGFDPSAPNVPPSMRVVVAGPPPGTNTAIGAVTGAVIGAAVGGPRAAGPLALFGAVAGAAIGSSVDAQNAANQRQVYVQDRQAYLAMVDQANSYRRALSACLQARGYSVR